MYRQPIVLASQSPRRKQLLEWAEIPIEVIVQPTAEDYPEQLAVDEVPVYIAKQKAIAVIQSGRVNKDSIVVAADTIVVLANEIIGKPGNREDALKILSQLSAQKHQVITGVVITDGKKEIAFSDKTDVWFHELSQEQISFYVDKYKPYDKAGAYAIQEWIGVIGIKSIVGDFYNVMGLPVSRVVQALKNF